MIEEYLNNLNDKHENLISRYASTHVALEILRDLIEEHLNTGEEIRLRSVNLALENTDIDPIEVNDDR